MKFEFQKMNTANVLFQNGFIDTPNLITDIFTICTEAYVGVLDIVGPERAHLIDEKFKPSIFLFPVAYEANSTDEEIQGIFQNFLYTFRTQVYSLLSNSIDDSNDEIELDHQEALLNIIAEITPQIEKHMPHMEDVLYFDIPNELDSNNLALFPINLIAFFKDIITDENAWTYLKEYEDHANSAKTIAV